MGQLDFSISLPAIAAVILVIAHPVVLLLLCRLPQLRGRNALQFATSALVIVLTWILFVVAFAGRIAAKDFATGTMIAVTGEIIYLEIWALLSRGYTLGLLVTLLSCDRPLDVSELAAEYRGGEGLSWIMRHRLSGLIKAGLVRVEGGRIGLTRAAGVPVARFCKLAIAVLGLGRTG